MVETGLALDPEVKAIFQQIEVGENFLLSGGAGSGKTYSLVQVIRESLRRTPTEKVACMTYTNAAVKEIEERVNHKNLTVTTIHDFLWDNIKSFQNELKRSLVELINDENQENIGIAEGLVEENFFDGVQDGIQYKEWLSLKDGIISHDELLLLANHLFKKYPKLADIIKDRFKYIFIDEYQDTHKSVIEIFLIHLQASKKQNIIGFFGDAMQSIYDDTIGNLDSYKGLQPGQVKEIKKAQNRRNPQRIIDLANLLRTDGITQTPSTDPKAPNMLNGHIKDGRIIFLHSLHNDISKVKEKLINDFNWSFDDAKKTKELNLTHNLIATKAGFRNLMDIYDKDAILDYKNRIKKYIKDKNITTDFTGRTFGQVIASLQSGKTGRDLSAVSPTAGMQAFIDNHPELYQIALNYDYDTFSKIYVESDQLIDDKKQHDNDENKKGSKRDNLIRHLFKIETNISLYRNGDYYDFLKRTDYRHRIKAIQDKRQLKENIESLSIVGDKTIEEIIGEAHEKGITIVDDKLHDFKTKHEYLYDRVKQIKYSEFQNLFQYLEGRTPFSTQHKTKGTEFDNVLVVLDNGGWNKYNFENLFLNTGTPTVLERTQKIFYVCCTRAKENLAVFYHSPKPEVINRANAWFGSANVYEI